MTKELLQAVQQTRFLIASVTGRKRISATQEAAVTGAGFAARARFLAAASTGEMAASENAAISAKAATAARIFRSMWVPLVSGTRVPRAESLRCIGAADLATKTRIRWGAGR